MNVLYIFNMVHFFPIAISRFTENLLESKFLLGMCVPYFLKILIGQHFRAFYPKRVYFFVGYCYYFLSS